MTESAIEGLSVKQERKALGDLLYALREITEAGFERRIDGSAITRVLFAWTSGYSKGVGSVDGRESEMLYDALKAADALLAVPDRG